MILQALHEYYYKLLNDQDSGVAPPGYSTAKVAHVLLIDPEGSLVDAFDISDTRRKKSVPKTLLVPEQVTRTSGVSVKSANILCDNAAYVLGLEQAKEGEVNISATKFDAFRTRNLSFLQMVPGQAAQAVRIFLEKWEPASAFTHPSLKTALSNLLDGRNIVFMLDNGTSRGYVHETPEIKAAWAESTQKETGKIHGQCLITGQNLPLARIHTPIKGVAGAQTSGASIVGFNQSSFTSYGKEQSFNAPVSKQAAFAYTTALNYLLARDTNRVRLADTTMVFWADRSNITRGNTEELILSLTLDPFPLEVENDDAVTAGTVGDMSEIGENNEVVRRIDPAVARQAKEVLQRMRAGLPVDDLNASFDAEARCFLLGLAPNAARLSIRFWQVSRFGDVLGKIAQHYYDMSIAGIDYIGGIVSPRRTLKALAIQEDAKNIPPQLGGLFLRSILNGQEYPRMLYTLALNRCRTGGKNGGVSTIRAAVIKACLTRSYRLRGQKQENYHEEKEAFITVSLNINHPSPAYQLGRLFSLLEKVQKDALGNQINATIRDRYFSAASATPGSVFPLLLRMSQHHITKAEYGNVMDKKIQDVLNRINASPDYAFPDHLNLDEQGLFILGYYHQNQDNYTKKEKEDGAASD